MIPVSSDQNDPAELTAAGIDRYPPNPGYKVEYLAISSALRTRLLARLRETTRFDAVTRISTV
jgi:hypothetical protein